MSILFGVIYYFGLLAKDGETGGAMERQVADARKEKVIEVDGVVGGEEVTATCGLWRGECRRGGGRRSGGHRSKVDGVVGGGDVMWTPLILNKKTLTSIK